MENDMDNDFIPRLYRDSYQYNGCRFLVSLLYRYRVSQLGLA